jgi:acyl-CoA synthetase (AMP-forming)/AMP-acid ligase II
VITGWPGTIGSGGDLSSLRIDGYLQITDRVKDMFIVGGFNDYPADIESILREHPSVGQVAVVGGPDERLGEVGVAFVVAAPETSLDPEELIAFSRQHLANFKVPRHVEIVDQLPLTSSLKVMKQPLLDRAAQLLASAGPGRNVAGVRPRSAEVPALTATNHGPDLRP